MGNNGKSIFAGIQAIEANFEEQRRKLEQSEETLIDVEHNIIHASAQLDFAELCKRFSRKGDVIVEPSIHICTSAYGERLKNKSGEWEGFHMNREDEVEASLELLKNKNNRLWLEPELTLRQITRFFGETEKQKHELHGTIKNCSGTMKLPLITPAQRKAILENPELLGSAMKGLEIAPFQLKNNHAYTNIYGNSVSMGGTSISIKENVADEVLLGMLMENYNAIKSGICAESEAKPAGANDKSLLGDLKKRHFRLPMQVQPTKGWEL
jgi:hypothetical protein